MKVRDYMDEVFVDELVRIDGKETRDECDPFCITLWEGITKDIPEDLQDLEILQDGWAINACIHAIEVFAPNRFEKYRKARKCGFDYE